MIFHRSFIYSFIARLWVQLESRVLKSNVFEKNYKQKFIDKGCVPIFPPFRFYHGFILKVKPQSLDVASLWWEWVGSEAKKMKNTSKLSWTPMPNLIKFLYSMPGQVLMLLPIRWDCLSVIKIRVSWISRVSQEPQCSRKSSSFPVIQM